MIVDTDKVLREADGPVEGSTKKLASGGKVISQKEVDTNLMKITLLQKERILELITVLCTNSFRCLTHCEFQMQRQQWRKNGENWRKSQHGS